MAMTFPHLDHLTAPAQPFGQPRKLVGRKGVRFRAIASKIRCNEWDNSGQDKEDGGHRCPIRQLGR